MINKLKANKSTLVFSIIVIFIIIIILWPVKIRGHKIVNPCTQNKGQIAQSCLMYSMEYSGSFPPDLMDLIKTGHLDDVKVFECPALRERNNQFLSCNKIEDNSGMLIVYLSGLTDKSLSDSVLTFCKYSYPDNSRNIGFIDRSVKKHSDKDFKKILSKMLNTPEYREQYSEEAIKIMESYLEKEP